MKPFLTIVVLSRLLAGQQAAPPLQTRDLVRAPVSFKTDAVTGKPSIATEYALVIGVGHFKDDRVNSLRYAESDAQEMFRASSAHTADTFPKTYTSSSAAMPRFRASGANWSSGSPKSRAYKTVS